MRKAGKILGSCVRGFLEKEVSKRAAMLTYYLVFAIFPFIIAVISLLGFLKLPMLSLEGEAAAFLPADVIALLNLTIAHMTETSSGAVFTFGIVFSIWFPYRAVKNLTDEVSDIYGEEKPIGHTKRILLLSLLILILIPTMLILMIIGERVLSLVAQYFPITVEFIAIWTKARFLPMAIALILLISAIYYFSPNRPPAWQFILPGAFLSTALWMVYSIGFSYYVDHMGNYSVIYGSIGAIIAFLIWINWSMTALLVGALFNQALREQYIEKGI